MIADLLYRVYERRLARALRGQPLPAHVGVILDGNRRFARAKALPSIAEGHRRGASKIDELLEWCDDLGIRHVTLWLLSTENLQRDSAELQDLVEIIAETVQRLATHPSHRARELRVTGVGALDVLPDRLRQAIKQAEEVTSSAGGVHVQIAVGYGGRQEITDALRDLLEERAAAGDSLADVIADLSPEAIGRHLYTRDTPDPDLIIRTSGEIRLSGFMLWQSAHSEYYFCDAYWPAFRKTDFLRALRDFAQRQRRFGR